MISNGFFLRPEMIEALNQAGLQEMQISIDGVNGNDTTQKVLTNLKKCLQWLREHARFQVAVSVVIGACPPQEAEEIISFARAMGFTPRVLLVHDEQGQLKLNARRLRSLRESSKSCREAGGNFPATASASLVMVPRRSNVVRAAGIFTSMNSVTSIGARKRERSGRSRYWSTA
jgi:molybdenum cofactor biosynthesis enzyme MoaA